VYLYWPFPGIIYEAKAKSTTAANTQAKIDALVGSRVVFDLTAGVWTVDSAAGDSATNCVVIVSGQYQTNTLNFTYSTDGTLFT
jgi:hypothetical protein